MEIRETKKTLQEMITMAQDLKRGFAGMVLLAPQILSEDDHRELSDEVLELATTFDSCASYLNEFARMGPHSRAFAPQKKK